jgi:hypothetical protein
MYVLTAAQAYQAALESSRLGHGYLTFALVEEGLTTLAADVKPADGQITAIEWFEHGHAPRSAVAVTGIAGGRGQQRLLRFEMDNSAGGITSNLQTPRLYSRRDAEAPVPIVAKLPASPR